MIGEDKHCAITREGGGACWSTAWETTAPQSLRYAYAFYLPVHLLACVLGIAFFFVGHEGKTTWSAVLAHWQKHICHFSKPAEFVANVAVLGLFWRKCAEYEDNKYARVETFR